MQPSEAPSNISSTPPGTPLSRRRKDSCSSYMPLESPTPVCRPKVECRRKLGFEMTRKPSSIHVEDYYDVNAMSSPTRDTVVSATDKVRDRPLFSSLYQLMPSLLVNDNDSETNDDDDDTSAMAALLGGVDNVKSKWLDYLNSFQESHYDTDQQMEEFIKVPRAVEGLLNYGFGICVDSFLYTLTILPIRFIWSSLLLGRLLLLRVFNKRVTEGPFRFHRRHCYQLIQLSIIYIIHRWVLMPISIGKFYHWIRGQNMVKLYLLIAIVEVFDRLMSSLGQDCLDSLYWNTTRRPRSSRLLVSVVVVLVYVAIHSLLLFVHVATLNVAINSTDQALISLLIGGNFAEIKSTVFKKYNKPNLFKIAASDICERFKLALFLTLVLTLNLSQGMDEKMIMNYVKMCGVVWSAEILSDWIKHAFITKFNFLSSAVYPEYELLLAGDVTGIGHEGVNLDHSHAVVKRIGFAQLPLVCVMTRYLTEAVKYARYVFEFPTWMVALGLIGSWFYLVVCKLSLGSILQRVSLSKLQEAPEFSTSNVKLNKKNA
eukprot:Nitzschia sp. Nitz4//scaffold79_size90958//34735//36448//NITZ4_005020-RA/size90958-snap-gene-0.82-mRNA-1//1//CDS//3329558234//1108//frame0